MKNHILMQRYSLLLDNKLLTIVVKIRKHQTAFEIT